MKRLSLSVLIISVLVMIGGCNDEDSSSISCNGDCFPNGVAAGDVDQSSVVLWARASYTGAVRFEYGRDPNFVTPADGFAYDFVADIDIPAKVEVVTGLLPGIQYYYRVCPGTCPSVFDPKTDPWGKFHTSHADGNNGLRFGVSSCFRGDMKPFVSINNVPAKGLDFFVALGDSIYADGINSGGRARSIEDFRKKYNRAYSRLNTPEKNQQLTGLPIDDNYFALARASTAFYFNIDDHEVVDNFAGGAPPASQTDTTQCNKVIPGNIPGTEPWHVCFCDPGSDASTSNLDNDEPLRRTNCNRDYINETDLYKYALQAWHEYNPVREERYPDINEAGDTGEDLTRGKDKLYRYRTFGKDAALFMLDARSFRDEANSTDRYDTGRTMLGKAQLDDLLRDLQSAENNGITWKFVLVPEPIQNLGLAGGDRFEGYAYERSIILDYIEVNCIANVVFISGDIHATIVNNLTYKSSALGLQRWSTAWDISTGPVAYSGTSFFNPPGPTATAITRGKEGEPYKPLDLVFQIAMDEQLNLFNRPWTGLGFEFFLVPPIPLDFQLSGGDVPVMNMNGSYVAGHSYGWTEFQIDVASQKLLVTTWGIDWYDAPTGYDVNPVDGKPDNLYSDNKLTDLLLNQKPYKLHTFEVLPRNGCPGCGDGICAGAEKCGGNDTTLLQCTTDCGKCPNGDPCGDDNMCESGLCSGDIVGICIFPQDNGQPCTRDKACKSGICNGLGDIAGFCTAPQANGTVCTRNKTCQSGLCDLGFCTAPNSKGFLSPCFNDRACVSGNCAAAVCGL